MSDERKLAILLLMIIILSFVGWYFDRTIGPTIILLFSFSIGFSWYFQWFTVNYWKLVNKWIEKEQKDDFA